MFTKFTALLVFLSYRYARFDWYPTDPAKLETSRFLDAYAYGTVPYNDRRLQVQPEVGVIFYRSMHSSPKCIGIMLTLNSIFKPSPSCTARGCSSPSRSPNSGIRVRGTGHHAHRVYNRCVVPRGRRQG